MNTEQKRERHIDAAVVEGKFTAERAPFWRRQWDKDPAGTEKAIASMAAGLVEPPRREPTESDYVRLFSGGRVELGEPDPPEAARFVRDVLGLRPVT
jgi:hypothetical protein